MSRPPEAEYACRRLEQIPVGGMITQEEMECLLGSPLPGYARLFGGEIRFALRRKLSIRDTLKAKEPDWQIDPFPEARFRIDYWKPLLQLRQAMTSVARPLLLQYFRIQ